MHNETVKRSHTAQQRNDDRTENFQIDNPKTKLKTFLYTFAEKRKILARSRRQKIVMPISPGSSFGPDYDLFADFGKRLVKDKKKRDNECHNVPRLSRKIAFGANDTRVKKQSKKPCVEQRPESTLFCRIK